MKTIITGSRSIKDDRHLREALRHCGWIPSSVLSGGSMGVDKLGEKYAARHALRCEVFSLPHTSGKISSLVKAERLVMSASALLAIWDGQDEFTKNIVVRADELGLRVYVHLVKVN